MLKKLFIVVILLLLIGIVFLLITGNINRSPEDLFSLSKKERAYHRDRVEKCNDPTSARMLYGYYKYVLKDYSAAQKWQNDAIKERPYVAACDE